MLFQQLDLSGLEGLSDKNQAITHALLAEYHNIFSLEPGELGCTDLAKHEIRVVHDECECMPFRLCNVPATFQRLMQNCLGELNLIHCLIYLDDVIVFLKIEVEHLQDLCIVFDCFRKCSLRLKPTKCKFFCNQITYLTHPSPGRVYDPAMT